MLPKSERFTKEDFMGIRPKVFFRCDVFDAACITLTTSDSPKIACVISKKTIKRSVDRNLIKRRFLNAIKNLDKPKYSVIFYPKKNSTTTPYSQLEEQIKKAFATLQ